MNNHFDTVSFLLKARHSKQFSLKKADKNFSYLYNNFCNLLTYLNDSEEADDLNFCEHLYQNVLTSAYRCDYHKSDIDENIFTIALRKDFNIKENSLIYLYNKHFSFEEDINLIKKDKFDNYYFFLFKILDNKMYKLASLILNEWNPKQANLKNNSISTIPINNQHPLLQIEKKSFEEIFSKLAITFKESQKYLSNEFLAYYFYINPVIHSVENYNSEDFNKFKTLFENKVIIDDQLKENILSLYIKQGFHLNNKSIQLLDEWNIFSHKGQAIIHLIEKLDFYITDTNEVSLNDRNFTFITINKDKIFDFLEKGNLNFINIWSNAKITKLLNSSRSSYQSPTSSHIKMHEDLIYFFQQLNHLTEYLNLERSELRDVKNKVEYNLNELGKGITDPVSQQSFIDISLKIDELFYQYSKNTHDTYIQKNKTKIRL